MVHYGIIIYIKVGYNMSQWNLATISIGCIIIMVSNQMENGGPLMLLGVAIAGFALSRFFMDLSKEKKKNQSSDQIKSKKKS